MAPAVAPQLGCDRLNQVPLLHQTISAPELNSYRALLGLCFPDCSSVVLSFDRFEARQPLLLLRSIEDTVVGHQIVAAVPDNP